MSTNYYEQTYIISPVLEDDEYDGIVNKYRELIEDNDGEIDEVDLLLLMNKKYNADFFIFDKGNHL